jgi:predicted AlkP superfamily phosphohydrolase/phosphomutase
MEPVRRALFLPVLLLLAGTLSAQAPPKRVVVFGIDGADAEVFEEGMRAGKFPNMAALAAKGCYGRLGTTNPAQSPVSWAAFSTGSNPGKTSIYDFLRRDPDVPGKIEIALGTKGWVAGPLGKGARIGGLAAVLLLVFLLLRLPLRRRRGWIPLVVPVVGALAAAAGAHRVISWVPTRTPRAISNRLGVPLWSVLGEAGVRSVVVEAPISFPADRARNLSLLSGLGTPDVQATWGFYSVFTEDARADVIPETGGFVDAVVFDAGGTARSRVYGPPDITLKTDEEPTERWKAIDREAAMARILMEQASPLPSARRFEERVWQHAEKAVQASCVLEIHRDPAARTATIRVGAGGPKPILDLPLPAKGAPSAAALPDPGDSSVRWGEPVVLQEKAWSAYVPFDFEMNRLVRVKGIGKFWLESVAPFRLLLTPISFDPREVPSIVDVSFPREFAPALAAKAGPFSLVGWPCLTNPIKDSMLSDEAFVAQVREITQERRRKLKAAMEEPGWRFLFVMFSEVDRVQHALWRHIDPKSPLHDPVAAKKYGPAIEEAYVAMDAVLGDILAAAGEDTTVIVMSDHGFAPFRRAVNLNTWLQKEGFLAGTFGTDRSVTQIFSSRNFMKDMDSAKTKAYAVGLGGIYLNLKGREATGSVDPKEYDAVCADIRKRLLELRDDDGTKVVHEVYLGKDLYKGPTTALYAPDLVVGFERGYRVSWQTTLAGGGEKVIEDNRFPWSGDHCSVDPSLVPGILLSNRKLDVKGATVLDIAPTVLRLFGVDPPPEWDGRSLLPK